MQVMQQGRSIGFAIFGAHAADIDCSGRAKLRGGEWSFLQVFLMPRRGSFFYEFSGKMCSCNFSCISLIQQLLSPWCELFLSPCTTEMHWDTSAPVYQPQATEISSKTKRGENPQPQMKLWVSMLSSTVFTNFSRKLLDLRILQEISYEKISEQAQAHSVAF